jgi:hypothetical protein
MVDVAANSASHPVRYAAGASSGSPARSPDAEDHPSQSLAHRRGQNCPASVLPQPQSTQSASYTTVVSAPHLRHCATGVQFDVTTVVSIEHAREPSACPYHSGATDEGFRLLSDAIASSGATLLPPAEPQPAPSCMAASGAQSPLNQQPGGRPALSY